MPTSTSPEERATILVVDDKHNMLKLMTKVLSDLAEVLSAEGGQAALRVLEQRRVDVVLCDLMMPDMDGLELLQQLRRIQPGAEFVLMTAYATVDTAVQALRLGAYDYLTKPFEPQAAHAVVSRALGRARLDPKASEETAQAETDTELEQLGLIGRSPAMRAAMNELRRFSRTDLTALILGETGTGKERFARALHALSERRDGPFIALNCAALPAELLESELFGHSKGAFTGAERARAGLFEEAHTGTLFLDEIGDLRNSLQAKLTRVLEERAVRRIGESRERKVDIRIIAATHRDLEAMVQEERFREDLWYRLNVARIEIPPLRARRDDIALLARHFLRECPAPRSARKLQGFSPEALRALEHFDWPGNVRQLRAAIERAIALADGTRIEIEELPRECQGAEESARSSEALAKLSWAKALEQGREQTARSYLEAVLAQHDGAVRDAAQHAGVERESFYRLLRRHRIDPSKYRREG